MQHTKRRDGILLDPFLFFSLVFLFFLKEISLPLLPLQFLFLPLSISLQIIGVVTIPFLQKVFDTLFPPQKILPNLHNCACLCISRLGDGLVPSYRRDMSITILAVT